MHNNFENTTAGEIKVFAEYQDAPLAVAIDQKPIQIKYFGFASYDNYLAKFFYNCAGENTYSANDISTLCRPYEAMENEYKQYIIYNIVD